MLGLDKFGRALRLQWLWQEWKEAEKPLVGSEPPCKVEDRLLFNASTTVTIRNGSRTKYWHHNRLHGMALRYLAPHLFVLVRRKNQIVEQELSSNAWCRQLQGKIRTTIEVEEFLSL